MSRYDSVYRTRHARELAQRPTVTTDAAGDILELGGECGLYVDQSPDELAIAPGDWIATEAGSRYLVVKSQAHNSRRHSQQFRWQLRCRRLPKHATPPADVRVIWLQWYPRGRRA